MKLLEHFDHPEKRQDKEHFKHLIQIALADGIIRDSEMEMLHRLGKNMGFTDPEIDDLLATANNVAYNPPYELTKRFDQIYSIIKMVLADGNIDSNQMRLASVIAIKSGFVDDEIPALLELLLNGIEKGDDEEHLFRVYKKKIMRL
ncbi:MAG: hypothetical protein Q8P34_13305 [Bacteroidota bacterium]|nr:hypothetical protein [Bacteroidota bacterium]